MTEGTWQEGGELGGHALCGASGAHYSAQCPAGTGSGCSWNVFIPSWIDEEQYVPVIGSVMC